MRRFIVVFAAASFWGIATLAGGAQGPDAVSDAASAANPPPAAAAVSPPPGPGAASPENSPAGVPAGASPAPSASLSPGETPPAGGCREEAAAAFRKLREAGSFRLTADMVNEDGPVIMTVDYVLPSRMYQKVQARSGTPATETILIEERAWANAGDGQGWTELPAEFAKELVQQIRETVLSPPAKSLTYTCLGKVTLDGRDTLGYRMEDGKSSKSSPAGQDSQLVRLLYIDSGTGLPARSTAALSGKADKPFLTMTYTYPAGLTITPPATGADSGSTLHGTSFAAPAGGTPGPQPAAPAAP